MAAMAASFKSLASWKTWWSGGDVAKEIAISLSKVVDPSGIPKGGMLLRLNSKNKVSEGDLADPHKATIAEALLKSYPETKDGSAYLLGDACLLLNEEWGHTILGKQSENPMVEKDRRTRALGEGTKLKLLLSYIRTSAGKSERGRIPEITYLKELAQRHRQARRDCTSPASTASSHSTLSAATLVLGEERPPKTSQLHEPLCLKFIC